MTVIFKTQTKTQKPQQKTAGPDDSENLDQKPDSDSKDITGKDIEKDLIDHDPSEGFETDINTKKNNEAENDSFERARKGQSGAEEFEIGQLGQQELHEDERARDETGNGSTGNTKASQRKF